MFKTISNWWNRKELRMEAKLAEFEQRYNDEITRQATMRQEAEDKLREAEDKLNDVEQEVGIFRTQAAEDDARRNGTEPWIEIKSADHDAVRGIHIELDWNVAFVQYLKDSGFKGRDDETIVQKWLAFLYEDLISRLEQKVVDNSDKPRVNDFE